MNLLLWCLWAGAHFHEPGDLLVRKAVDRTRRWSSEVTAPLRAVRRALKSAPPEAPDAASAMLRENVKAAELDAERIEQSLLEALTLENLAPDESADGRGRARRALAAYARLAEAAKSPGFSVTLLEELIEISFPASESGAGQDE